MAQPVLSCSLTPMAVACWRPLSIRPSKVGGRPALAGDSACLATWKWTETRGMIMVEDTENKWGTHNNNW